MDIVLLIGSLAVILIAAELFTNGIEWFGHKLNLAEGAVGSVLAAVATAMPETLIPVIAILGPVLFGGDTETVTCHRHRARSWVPRSCCPRWRCS